MQQIPKYHALAYLVKPSFTFSDKNSENRNSSITCLTHLTDRPNNAKLDHSSNVSFNLIAGF